MILLANKEEKLSREFYSQYSSEFTTTYFYPECVEVFPTIKQFPAVVVQIPEVIKDKSMYGKIQRIKDYEYLGHKVSDLFSFINEKSCEPKKSYANDIINSYVLSNRLTQEDLIYFIDIANKMTDVPEELLIVLGGCSKLNEKSSSTLDIKFKDIYINNIKAEIIAEHEFILYPSSFEDIKIKFDEYIKEIS